MAEQHIRWMINRDLPAVLDIELQSFRVPWDASHFERSRVDDMTVGMVMVEHQDIPSRANERVIGHMIYQCHRSRYHLVRLAVHPDRRRERVGQRMIGKIAARLQPDGRRKRILAEVRESNVVSQKFLAACGFEAIAVLPLFYGDTQESAYLMRFGYRPLPAPAAIPPKLNHFGQLTSIVGDVARKIIRSRKALTM